MSDKAEFRFDEVKATQVAARFVALAGNRMSHMALIKLLYIADREALKRWGRPITGGRYVSMPHGPVISNVYDLMKQVEGLDPPTYWTEHLTKLGNDMSLRQRTREDRIAEAEAALIDEVFAQFGSLDKWKLRDLTHDFPEWHDPKGSSDVIAPSELLSAVGKSEAEVQDLSRELDELNRIDSIIGG